jgi:hypothetical protein
MKYLFVLILFVGCKGHVRKLPAVVKNGCGKYAVLIKDIHKDGNGEIDRSEFLGIRGKSDFFFSIGQSEPYYDSLIRVTRSSIWDSGDTVYDYPVGYEKQFDDSLSALKAVNGYLNRVNKEKAFMDSISVIKKAHDDSIKLCHTYK